VDIHKNSHIIYIYVHVLNDKHLKKVEARYNLIYNLSNKKDKSKNWIYVFDINEIE